MSDSAVTKDCLTHYDNRHIQLRRDFYDLCAYDKGLYNQRKNENGKVIKDEPDQECMAKILRLLETLTDHQRTSWFLDAQKLREQGLNPKEPAEYAIQLSYGAIAQLLYNTHGESTIRNSVAVLIERQYIKWFQETKNSIPFYILNTEMVQRLLKEQAENSLSGVEINSPSGEKFQVLKSTAKRPHSTATRPKSTPEMSKTTGAGVAGNNNNKDKETDKKSEKEESTFPRDSQTLDDSSSALAPPTLAPASSQEISPDDDRADAQNTNEQAQLSTTHVDKTPPHSGKDAPEKPNGKGKGRGNTAFSKQTPPEFTPEGQKVWDAWCSLFKSPPPAAEKTITCANDLYARLVPWCQELQIPCKKLLKDIKGWLYATDPDWYRRKGVALCDISAKFERWQSAKMEELSNPEPAQHTSHSTRTREEPIKPAFSVPDYTHMTYDEIYGQSEKGQPHV